MARLGACGVFRALSRRAPRSLWRGAAPATPRHASCETHAQQNSRVSLFFANDPCDSFSARDSEKRARAPRGWECPRFASRAEPSRERERKRERERGERMPFRAKYIYVRWSRSVPLTRAARKAGPFLPQKARVDSRLSAPGGAELERHDARSVDRVLDHDEVEACRFVVFSFDRLSLSLSRERERERESARARPAKRRKEVKKKRRKEKRRNRGFCRAS